mgnify:CR=1 FL=1
MLPKKKRRGRPVSIFIDEDARQKIQMLAGFGLKHDQIAIVMGITEKTMERKCKLELSRGALLANSNVIKSLYRNAVENNNVAAQIFWAKARCHWKETSIHEIEGPVPLDVILGKREGGDEDRAAQASERSTEG